MTYLYCYILIIILIILWCIYIYHEKYEYEHFNIYQGHGIPLQHEDLSSKSISDDKEMLYFAKKNASLLCCPTINTLSSDKGCVCDKFIDVDLPLYKLYKTQSKRITPIT